MNSNRHRLPVIFLAVLSIQAAPLFAQPKAATAVSSPQWGTTLESILNVNAADFDVPLSSLSYSVSSPGLSRYLSSGVDSSPAAGFYAGVHLPTGAVVTRLAIQGCDDTASGSIGVEMLQHTISAGAADAVAVVGGAGLDTGTAATPNCGFFQITLPAPVTIDNSSSAYSLFVRPTGVEDGSVRFAAVHVYYLLQVSPAPATATFLDVPITSPQFKFVEALFAAGITAGCGGGNFCPDQPV